MTTNPPKLFDYLDVFKYLQDYFEFRKKSEVAFSYEMWASELKFRSRSYLRMVVLAKKRLSPQMCESFCLARNFDPVEREYFESLVKYSQASLIGERQFYGEKLIRIIRSNMDRTSIDVSAKFLSDPIYARLLVLLGFGDITPVASTFARLLDKSEEMINEYLNNLKDLSLASVTQVDGREHWQTTHVRFDVPNQAKSMAIMRFHEQSLLDSIGAFHQDKELRRYKSLLLPLSSEELSELYAMLEEFSERQLARFQADTYQGRRLFQMNMNVFAVTEPDPSNEDLHTGVETSPTPMNLK